MTGTIEYDPLGREALENPYPLYERLRESAPVFWHDGMQSWVLARYSDCRRVLREHEVFARDRRRIGEDIPDFRQSVQTLDPPSQVPLRGLFLSSLRAQDQGEISDAAQRHIAEIFARHADGEPFDFMAHVAGPIALSITCDMMGVDEPPLDEYAEISDKIARRMDSGLDAANIEPGDRARKQLNSLVDDWYEETGRPGVLADVRQNAAKADVPEHYVRNTVGLTFNASFGTLYAMAGSAMYTLLRDPTAWDQLNRDSLAAAVDELIRFDGPAQGTSRVAMQDNTIRDAEIRRGQVVMTLLASANRDDEEFSRPNDLLLDRSPNRHLGFGWGSHACLGTVFGQFAVQELLRGLIDAPSRMRLAAVPTRRDTATVRTVETLPVRF